MEVGVHCSFAQCKRLDFLPFVCDCCKHVFCKDHRLPSTHQCKHIDTNEPSILPEKKQFLFQCSLSGCKKRDVTEVTCAHCEKSFCIQHRHQEDHNCPAVVEDKKQSGQLSRRGGGREAAVVKTVGAAPTSKGGGARGQRSSSKGTSAKVALMKLKLKAVGLESIPQTERVYYEVQLPNDSGLPNTPTFFSKEWSVGKTVDNIAQRFKLKNDNHKPHAQKLQLHTSEGEVLKMSTTIHSLTDTVIPIGTILKLEYDHS